MLRKIHEKTFSPTNMQEYRRLAEYPGYLTTLLHAKILKFHSGPSINLQMLYQYYIARRGSPNPSLGYPTVIQLEESYDQQRHHAVIQEHGREEPHPLARNLPDGLPNPGELANGVEAVRAHITAEDLVRVPHPLMKRAVVFCRDHAQPEESNAARVEGDTSSAFPRRVHLRAATAGSAQDTASVDACATKGRLDMVNFTEGSTGK